MAVFEFDSTNESVDEIKEYQIGRYLSSNEAAWRILGFQIHERYPSVTHLAVHLENGQRVYFTEKNAKEKANDPPKTTLTEFFKLCQKDEFAATLLYHEIPKYYSWNKTKKQFVRRKKGVSVKNNPNIKSSYTLGRVYSIHPSNSECFFLRMLLHNIRGPQSFVDLKTIDGILCRDYREACLKLGLLEHDNHWNETLTEASLSCNAKKIRELFAIILTTCGPSDPLALWESHKNSMSEDILNKNRKMNRNDDLNYSEEVYNQALISLEDACFMINNKVLNQLGLQSPTRSEINTLDNDFLRETQHNTVELKSYVEYHENLLNSEQLRVYETMLEHITTKQSGIFFLDAPGGTGKTFLLNLILARVRMERKIALAVASSGIAATLLDGGRTAHSTFKLPLNIHEIEIPTCNIGHNSGMATVLRKVEIIILEECAMMHKKSIEAIDRTMKDLRQSDELMGGALILLSGR